MEINWESLTPDRYKTLIGRPKLTLIDYKCKNIVCGKNDSFKAYKDHQYICECGFMVVGSFHLIEHKTKLYCSTSPCIENKTKMDISCLKCSYIRER